MGVGEKHAQVENMITADEELVAELQPHQRVQRIALHTHARVTRHTATPTLAGIPQRSGHATPCTNVSSIGKATLSASGVHRPDPWLPRTPCPGYDTNAVALLCEHDDGGVGEGHIREVVEVAQHARGADRAPQQQLGPAVARPKPRVSTPQVCNKGY